MIFRIRCVWCIEEEFGAESKEIASLDVSRWKLVRFTRKAGCRVSLEHLLVTYGHVYSLDKTSAFAT